MKRQFLSAALAFASLAGACVGDEPVAGGSAEDSGVSTEGPVIDPGSGSSSSSSSSSSGAPADAAPPDSGSDAPEPHDSRCDVQVPLGPTSLRGGCGLAASQGTSVPLATGRYEIARLSESPFLQCEPVENWRATLDVAPDGLNWVFYLSIEVDGLRSDYTFSAAIAGELSDRTIAGTPLCGSVVPFSTATDGGSGQRTSRFTVKRLESGEQRVEFTILHPVSGSPRPITFKSP